MFNLSFGFLEKLMAAQIQKEGIPRASSDAVPPEVIYRHPAMVRIFHWTNAVCFVLLLMSGLQIFNAHPRLYVGSTGYLDTPAVFEIGGNKSLSNQKNWLRVGSVQFDTTGYLGVAKDVPFDGIANVAFPEWMTLPSAVGDLGRGRGWHFLTLWVFAANLTVYWLSGFISRRFWREFRPTAAQLKPRAIARDLWMHVRLRHTVGEEAKRYNLTQKLVYIAVVFVLLPTMIGTGMTMSPSALAAFPWLLDFFHGRQTARTIHFVVANLLVLFVAVHVFQVFVAGFFNEMRSMITGYFVVPREKGR
jgi:thiosulfate reductase cytochrome b subunit